MSNASGESFVTLLDWALRWWVGGRDPGLALVQQVAGELRPVTRWTTAALLAMSLVMAGTALVVRRRGSDLAEAVLSGARFLLVASAGWLVLAAGWSASEALGSWIIGSRSGASEFVASVTEALADAEPALATTLAVLGTASILGFIAVVLLRVVLAVLLAVGVPVIAAASPLLPSRTLRSALVWVAAVLAFRPMASIVYRVGHVLVTTSGQPVVVLLAVILTFLIAAATLPAFARLAGVGVSS